MKKSLRKKVYEKYNKHCAYCGNVLEYKDMQVDHFVPQRSNFLTQALHGIKDINDINNLMPSCRRCNHYKRSHFPENFRKMIKTLHERIKKIYIAKVALDYGIIILKPHDGLFYYEKQTDRHA